MRGASGKTPKNRTITFSRVLCVATHAGQVDSAGPRSSRLALTTLTGVTDPGQVHFSTEPLGAIRIRDRFISQPNHWGRYGSGTGSFLNRTIGGDTDPGQVHFSTEPLGAAPVSMRSMNPTPRSDWCRSWSCTPSRKAGASRLERTLRGVVRRLPSGRAQSATACADACAVPARAYAQACISNPGLVVEGCNRPAHTCVAHIRRPTLRTSAQRTQSGNVHARTSRSVSVCGRASDAADLRLIGSN